MHVGDNHSGSSESAPQVAYGLLLTGEGLAVMNPERLQMLGEMVGALGLNVTVLEQPLTSEQEPELPPTPASRQDFVTFADEHGYTSRRAHRAWNAVHHAAYETFLAAAPTGHPDRPQIKDPYPPVRRLDLPTKEYVVDLNTVYDRLRASRLTVAAWQLSEKQIATVDFLADLVNHFVVDSADSPIVRAPLSRGLD